MQTTTGSNNCLTLIEVSLKLWGFCLPAPVCPRFRHVPVAWRLPRGKEGLTQHSSSAQSAFVSQLTGTCFGRRRLAWKVVKSSYTLTLFSLSMNVVIFALEHFLLWRALCPTIWMGWKLYTELSFPDSVCESINSQQKCDSFPVPVQPSCTKKCSVSFEKLWQLRKCSSLENFRLSTVRYSPEFLVVFMFTCLCSVAKAKTHIYPNVK